MAAPGDVFTLHDGETVTIRALTPELLELDAAWGPIGDKPPMHRHPIQDERFEVREGALNLRLGGTTHVVRAGASFDVPRGTAHAMWAAGPGPTRASWQVRPALRTADFFEYVHTLHTSGRTGKHGTITPLGAGLLLTTFRDEFQLALPTLVQRPATSLLAAAARLRGYPSPKRHRLGTDPQHGGLVPSHTAEQSGRDDGRPNHIDPPLTEGGRHAT